MLQGSSVATIGRVDVGRQISIRVFMCKIAAMEILAGVLRDCRSCSVAFDCTDKNYHCDSILQICLSPCDYLGLTEAGRFGSLEGRFGQQSWPLPEFPENRGGCPTEVYQRLGL